MSVVSSGDSNSSAPSEICLLQATLADDEEIQDV